MSSNGGQGVTGGSILEGMSKQYVPLEHEPRLRARWDAVKAFAADPAKVLSGEKKPYAMFIPPPNVTGALHLGHALNNTLQDILTRSHRMMGYEALWMPGTDHAGIATQAVVEKRLRQDGELKGPLKDADRNGGWTREKFVSKIQAWKDEYEARITEQLKAMGASCDFSRQRFTMDPVCAAAVREAFFRLFRDGLIYRGKRLVNWDPVLQTAVADDECYDEEINGNFYYLRYPLVHASSMDPAMRTGGRENVDPMPVTWGELARRGYPGAEAYDGDVQAWVTVATTRPETYLGDTAVAVNPHDRRAKALRGLYVELPLVGRVIPVIEDEYVVLPRKMAEELGREEDAKDAKSEFASGFLKVTPAHDQNDYELGQRHKLEMINVMAPDGSISDKHGWSDVGDAQQFVGKKREEARKLVVKYFGDHFVQGSSEKLLEQVKPYRHSVKHSDRSKAVVEPYLSDQWYVKVTDERMAKAANEALGEGSGKVAEWQSGKVEEGGTRLRFHPERYAKTYQQWHEGIRDWCISRQLWWGHRIPVWSAPIEDVTPAILNRFSDERVGVKHYAGRLSVCIRHEQDHEARDFYLSHGFTQDPDVLDTWFSSALWPLSTLGWPDPAAAEKMLPGSQFNGLLEAYNPSSVLSTAREIITLWVSRMVMMNRYLLPEGWEQRANRSTQDSSLGTSGLGRGPVPFRDVFIHAVVQDGEGRKMSKSLGNGVDPLDIIASHGADAMRFTLCQMTTQTQDVRMPVQKDSKTGKNTSPKFDLGRNFANKLWNAARFAIGMLQSHAPASGAVEIGKLSAVDRWMLGRLETAIETCTKAISAYEFNAYAEACYDLLWRDFCDFYLEAIKPTVAEDAGQRAVLRCGLEAIVRLLHPVMPFVTEAVHEQLSKVPGAEVKGLTLASGRDGVLCLAGWPRAQGLAAGDAGAAAIVVRVRELAGLINQARAGANLSPKVKLTLHASENVEALLRQTPRVVETLCALEGVTARAAGPQETSLLVRFEGTELRLTGLPAPAPSATGDTPAVGAGGSEVDRLTKLKDELTKKIGMMQGRLSNAGYIAKAPPKLVEETQSQLKQAQDEVAAIEQSLRALGA